MTTCLGQGYRRLHYKGAEAESFVLLFSSHSSCTPPQYVYTLYLAYKPIVNIFRAQICRLG